MSQQNRSSEGEGVRPDKTTNQDYYSSCTVKDTIGRQEGRLVGSYCRDLSMTTMSSGALLFDSIRCLFRLP